MLPEKYVIHKKKKKWSYLCNQKSSDGLLLLTDNTRNSRNGFLEVGIVLEWIDKEIFNVWKDLPPRLFHTVWYIDLISTAFTKQNPSNRWSHAVSTIGKSGGGTRWSASATCVAISRRAIWIPDSNMTAGLGPAGRISIHGLGHVGWQSGSCHTALTLSPTLLGITP